MADQSSPTKVPAARAHGAGTSRASSSSGFGAASAAEGYRLSRIQAEGWKAAHRIAASTPDRLDGTQIDEPLNPYAADPERSRWSRGFIGALAL